MLCIDCFKIYGYIFEVRWLVILAHVVFGLLRGTKSLRMTSVIRRRADLQIRVADVGPPSPGEVRSADQVGAVAVQWMIRHHRPVLAALVEGATRA